MHGLIQSSLWSSFLNDNDVCILLNNSILHSIKNAKKEKATEEIMTVPNELKVFVPHCK